MAITGLAVFASNGPFGPTADTCVLLPCLLLGPFVLLALSIRSLLVAEPLSRGALGLMVIGTAALSYFLWPLDADRVRPGFWTAWRIIGVVVALSLTVVLVREGAKRGWVRR